MDHACEQKEKSSYPSQIFRYFTFNVFYQFKTSITTQEKQRIYLMKNMLTYKFYVFCMHAKLPRWCLTLFNLMDSSPSSFSVHGIL